MDLDDIRAHAVYYELDVAAKSLISIRGSFGESVNELIVRIEDNGGTGLIGHLVIRGLLISGITGNFTPYGYGETVELCGIDKAAKLLAFQSGEYLEQPSLLRIHQGLTRGRHQFSQTRGRRLIEIVVLLRSARPHQ